MNNGSRRETLEDERSEMGIKLPREGKRTPLLGMKHAEEWKGRERERLSRVWDRHRKEGQEGGRRTRKRSSQVWEAHRGERVQSEWS